jgi:cyclophilin family peptidyl-prolyl cis-trans isomerase
MTSPRRPSRRIPPKSSRGPRPTEPMTPDPGATAGDATGGAGAGAGAGAVTPPTLVGGAVRPGSRSANRAAKRATSPRPKVRPRNRGRSSNTPLIVLAVAAVAIGAAVLFVGNPFGTPTPSASPSAAPIVGDGTCPTAQPAALGVDQTRTVTIKTEKGDIVMRIDGARSPGAAGNFVALVACKFYDGSDFHRTATLGDGTPFVVQGGAAEPGTGSIPYSILDEPVTSVYHRGSIAMARSSGRNTQTSQFFIVLDDKAAPILVSNGNNYALFGEVISGMDVVDAIYQASGGAEQPVNPIAMTSVTVGPGPAATASPAATTAPTAAPTTAPSTGPSPTP